MVEEEEQGDGRWNLPPEKCYLIQTHPHTREQLTLAETNPDHLYIKTLDLKTGLPTKVPITELNLEEEIPLTIDKFSPKFIKKISIAD